MTNLARSLYATTSNHVAMGVALAVLGASPAFAQDVATEASAAAAATAAQDPAAVSETTEASDDDIVVTGYRAALQSAVNTKKRQEQIVESVSAEDIGKLPDASIGESIARLPGVTSQRLNGRANVIAIRGFGPDFSQTLLNGREQTSTNDNRGVEFDQYPSEVVNQVVVYKSPNASLIGQGLVGTVDIRTIRPLDYGKEVVAIGARASLADIGKLNAGSSDKGYRANITYVDQFADDTFGVAVAASYTSEPYQSQEFNAWGYSDNFGTGNVIIQGSKSFVTSTELKRFGINGSLQARPVDNLTMTLDVFYSHFNDDQFKRGIELPVGWFGTGLSPVGRVVRDGQIVEGTFTNVQGVVRNDIFQRKADLWSVGYNTTWDSGDGWKVMGDIGWSSTDRNELSLESYSGTGYNWQCCGPDFPQVDPVDTIGFVSGSTGTVFDPTLDYSDPNLIVLTDPLGWGGSIVQAGYYNDRIIKDELLQLRGELEREFDNSFLRSIQVGMNYTDRDKQLTPDEFFITLPGGATEVTIPSSYLLTPTSLDYLGLGPIVSYDARDLIRDGVLILQPNLSNDIPAKAYHVEENVWTGYVQANIDTQIGSADVTGNIGVQFIHTDQSSSGIAFASGVQVPVRAGDSYWMVLPSLNINARLPGDWVVRFAAAREIQRPRLDQMRVAIGYGWDATEQRIEGGGGNPTLRPYEANAVDFNVEKYFGGNGYVALQLFYKDIVEYIDTNTFTFDYAGFPPPAGMPPGASTVGTLNAPVNTGGGSMYGFEVGATLPFGMFSKMLDGFGLTGGVGYTKTKVEDAFGNKAAIPGYSKWVANGTAYFEKHGFNARASVRYRSTFLGDFTGFGGSPTRRQALPETIVDGQIGYDFQPGSTFAGLSVYLQGQNLTDERFASVTSTSTPLQVIDYQIYGRRFLAGFTFKF